MLSTDCSKGSQYSRCELQICSHPACWEETKRLSRDVHLNSLKASNLKCAKPNHQVNFPQFQTDELPCLSILNLLEDVQYESLSPVTATSCTSNQCQSNLGLFQNFKNFSFGDSDIVTKLHLKTLNQESANGITIAPANTPLHSSTRCFDVLATNNAKNSSSYTNDIAQSHSVSNLDLNYERGGRKRMYIWKSTKKRKTQPRLCSENKQKSASNLLMPLDALPPQSSKTTWKSNRAKKLLKPLHLYTIQAPVDTKKVRSASKAAKDATSNKVPREIEKLRFVPIDLLLRVVKMALHNKVLTLQQAGSLMYQVTGQNYKFYEVDSNKNGGDDGQSLYLTSQKKIHTHRSAKLPSKSTMATSPIVYKLDPAPIDAGKQIRKQHLDEQRVLNPIKEVVTPNQLTLYSSPLPQLRSYSSAIRSTVGCVTKSSRNSESCLLPKPFHYRRNRHSMSLHPLPTPPPSSPSTERDSKYNEILGGSTVIVNPSFGESARSYEMPISESSLGIASNEVKGGSSTKSTLWPQIDEALYVDAEVAKIDVAKSSEPDFEEVEDNNSAVVAEASSKERSIEGSFVPPPPPSPEMPSLKQNDVTNDDQFHVKEAVL